ncbi:SpvB/TcaC N-terminal domain-containing protein [Luteibacter sp. 3190]|uniref:SpvB/TcaC N-terminal domain-containing protein n=1 Tax=Luteibacter sp. 3190 TaxID=2817736 RepID=UPI002862593B|nr:SpvB/TcaC N-terminal domain-containing protein [Luteibacter sp. 3190]MDR6938129.1 RHS repeat-associated protein [Luteibacter sp. 3190]
MPLRHAISRRRDARMNRQCPTLHLQALTPRMEAMSMIAGWNAPDPYALGGPVLTAPPSTLWSEPDATGQTSFELPLPFTSWRAAPALRFVYRTVVANGAFGLGWNVECASIRRYVQRGTPRYDDDDSFVGPGGELLVAADERAAASFRGVALPREYRVRRYVPQVEGAFDRIERWTAGEDDFWLVQDAAGNASLFGKADGARLVDPDAPSCVAEWRLQEVVTATGDRTCYRYRAEDGAGRADDGRDARAARYLERVCYGNVVASTAPYGMSDRTDPEDAWHFEFVLDYGERGVGESAGYVPDGEWLVRQDPVSDYRYGFEHRCLRLCRQFLMFHRFAALGDEPVLVRRMQLDYDASPRHTMLRQVTSFGYDDKGREQASVPVSLTWNAFDPGEGDVRREPAFDGRRGCDCSMTDLYRDGVPGLLWRSTVGWVYREPVRADGTVDGIDYLPPKALRVPATNKPGTSPASTGIAGPWEMIDASSDGKFDWLVSLDSFRGSYQVEGRDAWSSFRPLDQVPATAVPEHAYWADVDRSGLLALIVVHRREVVIHRVTATGSFRAAERVPHDDDDLPLPGAADFIGFAPVLGPRSEDIFRIRTDGAVDVWPGLGHGRFGRRIALPALDLGGGLRPSDVHVVDLDGDGLADIVYRSPAGLRLYMNLSGHGFGTPVVRAWPEGTRWGPGWRLDVVDFSGRGGPTALLRPAPSGNDTAAEAWRIDIGEPFALRMGSVTNHQGCTTRVSFRSGAQEWMDEKKAGAQGQGTRHPFVDAVAKRVTTHDEIAGQELRQEHAYRLGHFDVERRLFRGYRDIETVTSSDSEPVLSVRCWYFVGRRDIDETPPESPMTPARARTRFTEWSATAQHDLPLSADPAIEDSGYRALAGLLQHRQTKAWVAGDWATTCLEAWRYQVRRTRVENGLAEACWLPLLLESAATSFDDEASSDTMTRHGIFLDYDIFGSCCRDIDIICARSGTATLSSTWDERLRSDSWDDQQRSHSCMQTRSMPWHLDGEEHWRPGCPGDRRVDGCRLSADILAAADIAAERFEGPDDPIATATLVIVSMECVLYGTGEDPVAPSLAALPVTTMVASMDADARHDLATVHGEAGLDALLAGAGHVAMPGRLLRPGEACFGFATTRVAYDDAPRFHRVLRTSPCGTVDWTHYDYDADGMFVTRMRDAVGRVTEVEYDYRHVLPWRSVDANGVVRAIAMDAFGATRAETIHGSGLDENGDVKRQGFDELAASSSPTPMAPAEAIANPVVALGRLHRRWVVDEFAWSGDTPERQPVHIVCLTADRYPDDARQHIRCDVDHVDGAGRILRQASSRLDTADAAWAVDGAIDMNAIGTVRRAYRPFFADTWRYRVPPENAPYDAFSWDHEGRLLSRRTPCGNESRITHRCWYTVFRDANWCASDDGHGVVLAAPSMQACDNGGRTIRRVRYIMTSTQDAGVASIERSLFAVNGVEESTFDARSFATDRAVRTHGRALGSGRAWSADHGTTWTLRNDAGMPAWTLDALGATRTYAYDPAGRLLTESFDGTARRTAVRHVYDAAYGEGGTNLAYLPLRTYDASGCREIAAASIESKPVRIGSRLLAGDDPPDWTGDAMDAQLEAESVRTEYAYDANGRVLGMGDDRGPRVAFRYSACGLLAGVTLSAGGAEHTLVASIEHDAAGRCIRMSTGGGMIRRWEYDDDGRRIRSMALSRDGAVIQDTTRLLDHNGNLVGLEEQDGRNRTYRYDSVGRILSTSGYEHPQAGDDGELPPLIVGPADDGRTRPYTRRFVHDAADNLVETIHTSEGSGERRLLMTVAPLSNRAVPASAGIADEGVDACFDAAGRLARLWPADTPLTWSAEGPLSSTGVAGSEHYETHLHDGAGIRRRHRWQHDGVSGETRYDLLTQRRTRGPESRVLLPLALDSGVIRVGITQAAVDIDYELDDDGLVSSRIADASGAMVSSEDYYPYGGTAFRSNRDATTEADKAYRYSNRERDPSGLLDYGSRAYAGWQARWTSPDPVGDFAGLNAYAMVHGNPVNQRDVDGRMTPEERRERERVEARFAQRPDVAAAFTRFTRALDDFVLGHLRANGGTLLRNYGAYAGYFLPAGSMTPAVQARLEANPRHYSYTTHSGYGRNGFVNTPLPVATREGAAPGLTTLSSGRRVGDQIEFTLPQRHDPGASQAFVSDFDGFVAGVNRANRAVEDANRRAWDSATRTGRAPAPPRPATPPALHELTIERIRTHLAPHQPREADLPGLLIVVPLLRVNGVPAAHGEVHALNEANYILSSLTQAREVAIFTARMRAYEDLRSDATLAQVQRRRQAFVACYNCDGIISGSADDNAGAIGRITTGRAPDQTNWRYPVQEPGGRGDGGGSQRSGSTSSRYSRGSDGARGSFRLPERPASRHSPYSRPGSANSRQSDSSARSGAAGTVHWRPWGAGSPAGGRDSPHDRGRDRDREGERRRERDRSRERRSSGSSRDRSRSPRDRAGPSRR